MSTIHEKEEEEEVKIEFLQFDFKVLYLAVKDRIGIIVLTAILLFGATVFLTKKLIKDTWQVDAILIRHRKNMENNTNMPYLYQQIDIHTAMETIKLRSNMARVINKLELDMRPEDLSRMIKVHKEKSNLVHIFVTHSDKHDAVKIANTVADIFITNYAVVQNSLAEKIFDYYITRKEKLLVKIKKLEKESKAFLEKHQVISVSSESKSDFEKLTRLEFSLVENGIKITDYKTRIENINLEVGTLPDTVSVFEVVKKKGVAELNDLESQLDELSQKYTLDNPKIIKIKDKISYLKSREKQQERVVVPDEVTFGRNQLKEGLIKTKIELQFALKGLEEQNRGYVSAISETKKRLSYLSDIELQYFELKKELDISHELLSSVEHKISAIKVATESNITDFELMEEARTPRYPLPAKRKLLSAGAGFVGFIAAILFILIREIANLQIKSLYDLQKALSMKNVFNVYNKKEIESEWFYASIQILVDDMLTYVKGKKNNLIVAGSDKRFTGKTFLLHEINDLIASTGRKILFIETLMSTKGNSENCFINKRLQGDRKHTLECIKINERVSKLYFLFDNDAYKTILERENIQSVVHDLYTEYDIIVWELFEFRKHPQLFDDVVSVADLTLLVGKSRFSERALFREMINFLEKRGVKNYMGIVNCVDKRLYEVV